MKKCVFAGSFDPFTKGHAYIVKTCLELFDEVIVAVMKNPLKKPFISEEERVRLIKKLYKDENRVSVIEYDGVVVDLLKECGTNIYVRGLRNTLDYEYENEQYFMSRNLDENINTIYLPTPPELLFLSSTFVRNCILFHRDIKDYVPEEIADELPKV